MFIHSRLVILMLALTLDGQVHTGYIIGGKEAVKHSRPYMVFLHVHMVNSSRLCDGFLLNEDFVMTAAHCQGSSYTALLGLHNLHDKNIQSISVKQSFPHKDYNESDYRNDIMLLKLSSKAHFNQNLKPIDLTDQGGDYLPKSCIVSGWGIPNKDSEYASPVLMEVNVTLLDNKKCPGTNMYCSDEADGEGIPSQGDSGGPLVCEDGKAYGVVSTEYQSAIDSQLIYTYTKIPDHISWIYSTMEHHRTTE